MRSCQIRRVQIGMTMPVMEPDLDAAVLRAWAAAVDKGPFSSPCWGEQRPLALYVHSPYTEAIDSCEQR